MNQRWYLFGLFVLVFARLGAQVPVCEEAVANIRQDSLLQFVKILTGRQSAIIDGQTVTISSRYATHPGNNLAADYLKQTLIQYGYEVQDIPFSVSGRNIIAYKNGRDNLKQAYLLGAHYDCVGNSSMAFQGADDNASGTAALLEAARVLQSTSFPYTLIIAFWDEEEIGLLGSKAFAPDGPLGFWDIKASLNLDMIGYDGNKDSVAMIHTFPVGQSVSLAIRMTELNSLYQTGLQMIVKNPGDKSTDHNSFWNVGATAIGLTEDYDHDFNPNWHLWSDSIENMHLPYFTQMSKLAIGAICDLSKTGKLTGTVEFPDIFLAVFPNPVDDKVNIQLSKPVLAEIILYTICGQEVHRSGLNGLQASVSTADIENGYYLLELRTNEGINRKPLLIQH